MNERRESGARAPDAAPLRGLLNALFAWAASGHDARENGLGSLVRECNDREVDHVVAAGLGPLLRYAVGEELETCSMDRRGALKAAEITARFTYGAQRESAVQVVDVCARLGVPVTLLKGVSIADQCYPAPHLRPMSDVDVLVPARDALRVESALVDAGYVRKPDWTDGDGEPHGAPLRDPRRDVWIEPHTALFHRDAPVNAGALFCPASVTSRSAASTFEERPVLRLSAELQLAYIACYWLRDITRNGMHPTFVVPLFDTLFLLESSARTLDWEGLLGSLDNELAAASLYLLLARAKAYGFDETLAPVLPRLAARQRIFGAAELWVMDRMLDACLVEGKRFLGAFGAKHPMIESSALDTLQMPMPFVRKIAMLPWNLVFPPRVPERYRVRYHAARMARFFRRR